MVIFEYSLSSGLEVEPYISYQHRRFDTNLHKKNDFYRVTDRNQGKKSQSASTNVHQLFLKLNF